MYNYAASVLFGVLAIALLFALAVYQKDVAHMRMCLAIAAFAWVACYSGYAAYGVTDTLSRQVLNATSIITTIVAVALFVAVMASS